MTGDTMAFPLPIDETSRLHELRSLGILDTPPEPEYDGIVKLAAEIAQAPIAVINFVDADQQWGKAVVGIEDSTAPRQASFCARTIAEPGRTLVVPDTTLDSRFAENPLVTGDPHLRFYAGAAIVSENGHALGSVCVADREPRELRPSQLEALKHLAGQVSALLALRRRTFLLEQITGRLEVLALRDELTGLPNRTLLMDRLQHALANQNRKHRGMAVMFCDVNDFKSYNDCFGHEVGDRVLHSVARRLKSAAREMDTVARLAGDEFVVMCPELTDPHDLVRVRQRLESAVAQPVECGGCLVVPSVSIGTTVVRDGDSAQEVLRRADHAMYAAKRAAHAAAIAVA